MAQRQATTVTNDSDWVTVDEWGDESDWVTVAAHQPAKPVDAAPTWDQKLYGNVKGLVSSVNPAFGTAMDMGVGALKGIGSTAYNVASALPGMPKQKPDFLEPQNAAQSVGHFGEQAAEFAVPSIKAASALRAAPAVARVAAEGGIAGGVGLAHGQSLPEAGVSAAFGAAIPASGSATGPLWQKAKEYLHKKITPRAMNSLMEVNPKWLEFGRDPGGRVVKEGIVASTKDSLKEQVDDQLKTTGLHLEAKLAQATRTGTNADVEPIVINALDNATKRIGMRTDVEFQNALNRVLGDILHRFPNLRQMTPLQIHRLKAEVGESVKWNGVKYEDDINQALLEIYRGLNDAVETLAPGAKDIQSKWGDLFVASKSLKESIQKDMTRPLMSGQGFFANIGRVAGATPIKTSLVQAGMLTANPQRSVAPVGSRTALGAFQAGRASEQSTQQPHQRLPKIGERR